MIVAPVAAGRAAALRELLRSMTQAPGMADPRNAVLPFGEFETLHVARFVLLDDATMVDFDAVGLPRPPVAPLLLAFLGDCDGPADALLADLARRAGAGLRSVFLHCEGFDAAGSDLLGWMKAHDVPPAATYVNWIGRTVRQVREESALQRALAGRVPRAAVASGAEARRIRGELVAFVDAEQRAGRLTLSPIEPTPLGWELANLAHAVGVPLAGIAALPLLLAAAPFFIVALRRRETSDAEICPRPRLEAVRALQDLEDHDVTNPFTALGAVKPGRFRRSLVTLLLYLLDYACRHVYSRGHLTRVKTIHFARWAFLDDKRRLIFASNYDGSLEAYMDDFINKVAWGLNLVFGNGLGYPHTDWLVRRGARREQPFKHYLRRHEQPNQVWYKAYPGLTAVDLERNRRIREGLQTPLVSDAQALAWLRLL